MTESIVVALITGVLTLLGVIISNQRNQAVHEEKLDEINRRLEEHNGYAEKFAQSSDRMAGIEKDIAVIKTTLELIKNTR